MGFSRQEYGTGLPFPSPGGLPDPGIEPASLASPTLQADPWCHLLWYVTLIPSTELATKALYEPHFRDEETEGGGFPKVTGQVSAKTGPAMVLSV